MSEFSEISKKINSKNPAERKKGLQSLTEQSIWRKHTDLVIALLEDPSLEIQLETLQALVTGDCKSFVGQLRHLSSHQDMKMRETALKALHSFNSRKNLVVFLKQLPHLDGPLQAEIKKQVDDYVADADDLVINSILQSLASTDEAVRNLSMEFFLNIADKKLAMVSFLNFSQSVIEMVRSLVFEETKKQRQFFAGEISTLLASDLEAALRVEAIGIAVAIEHPNLLELLRSEMKHSDWLVQRNAIQRLGDIKAKEALPDLVAAMDITAIALSAIQALDKFRDPALLKEFLKRLLNNGESEQLALIDAVKNLAGNDSRLIESFVKFMGTDHTGPKVKKVIAGLIIDICRANNQEVPAEVQQTLDLIAKEQLEKLPDLGLKLDDGL